MNREERIKQLKQELAELELTPEKKNDISWVACQKMRQNIESIRTVEATIRLDSDAEEDIATKLKIINRESFSALKVLEKDIAEREG